jgi:hypothetical protein
LPGALASASESRGLALAVVGVLLTRLGASASNAFLPGGPARVEWAPGVVSGVVEPRQWGAWLWWSASRAADPWLVVVEPIRGLLELGGGGAEFARSLFMLVWAVLVWGLVGGTIARMAAVGASGEVDGVGVGTTLRFVSRRVGALVAAPLGPLVALGLLAIPGAVLGWIGRSESQVVGGVVSALTIVPLLLAIPSAMLLVGVAVSWPLMVLTVAVEGEDGFEALSRSLAYVRRRAGHFALAVLACWGLGTAGVMLAGLLAGLVIDLTSWAFALGGGGDRVASAFRRSDPLSTSFGVLPSAVPEAIRSALLRCVGLVAYAWAFSFFWSAFARIYLLLRLEVDGTPWHDLGQPDEEDEPFAPDPPGPPPAGTP